MRLDIDSSKHLKINFFLVYLALNFCEFQHQYQSMRYFFFFWKVEFIFASLNIEECLLEAEPLEAKKSNYRELLDKICFSIN